MEATAKCKTKFTRKQTLINMGMTAFGLMVAMFMEKFGYGLTGWFIGGLIMGLGILFAYKKPEERWKIVNISVLPLGGCVMATVHYLFSL